MRGHEFRPTWKLLPLTLAVALILAGPAWAIPDPLVRPAPAPDAGVGPELVASAGHPVGTVGPPVIRAAPSRPGDSSIRRRSDPNPPGGDSAHRDDVTLPRETPRAPEDDRRPIIGEETEAGRLMPPPGRDIRGVRVEPRAAIDGADRGPRKAQS